MAPPPGRILTQASCADRQRTIRELEVGKTLFKEGERWVIKHQADDYKTGRAYGQRPPMVIAPHIYPEVWPLVCAATCARFKMTMRWAGRTGIAHPQLLRPTSSTPVMARRLVAAPVSCPLC